jgi:triosephosphate isomerase
MNIGPRECEDYVSSLKTKVTDSLMDRDVVLCVPSVDIPTAIKCAENSNINIGAQNIHFEDSGAFTGEISVHMIKELGVHHVIIGHSERRNIFGETEETINKKICKAISNDIYAIACIGENKNHSSKFASARFIKIQTGNLFVSVVAQQAKKVIIAYEPVWAIGTGTNPSMDQIQTVCSDIRKIIAGFYGQFIADEIRIIYGGSVNSQNAKEITSLPDVDGLLVGGASITPEFLSIINYDKE